LSSVTVIMNLEARVSAEKFPVEEANGKETKNSTIKLLPGRPTKKKD